MSTTNEEYDEVLRGKILLNVGGTPYITTTQTLMESRYMRSLADYYSDISGSWFIDRGGLLFREVLYYLRTGELFDRENLQNLRRLKSEARFYGLPNLERKINLILNQGSNSEENSCPQQ